MPEQPGDSLAVILRRLRTRVGKSQEELAFAAGLSPRTVSDIERGLTGRAHIQTVQRLGDALGLQGDARATFEEVARGRRVPGASLAQEPIRSFAAATRSLPCDAASFTGRGVELQRLIESADSRGVAGICSICGMAGVGKTTPNDVVRK